MRWIQRARDACLAILFCMSLAVHVQAITIDVNFASGTLFSSLDDAKAKAAINAAALDISTVITSSLNAITTDVYMGTSGSTTATFDWSFNYLDPSTGNSTSIPSATIAADTVSLFVGARSLSGNTLGVGGPGSVGWSLGASGFPSQSPAAVNNAEALSEQAMSRGAGPRIGTVNGTWDWSGYVDNYSIDYGISYGSLALDNDASSNWHFDHNASVASGKNDLYSVALHEILHAIGIGSSDSWDDLTSGTTWTGLEVQALNNGSGAGLIHPDDSHIASSIMSTSIVDGSVQEVVMDPNITQGTRKELTLLDLAFLRDIGYSTVIPTFPPNYDGDNDVDGADLAFLQTWYGVNGNADADNDGDTDGADFLVWQRAYTGALAAGAIASVPEPSTAAMLLTALLGLSFRVFSRDSRA